MPDTDPPNRTSALALMDAMKNPVRLRVLTAVSQRRGLTVKELADRLGEPARRVRHQLKRLVEDGLIEVEGTTPRRNARERHYRAIVQPKVNSWEEIAATTEDRRRIGMALIGLVLDDIRRAVEAGTFGTQQEHHEVRIAGEVDEADWQELDSLNRRYVEEVEDVMRRSARRLEAEGKEGKEVIWALFSFGAPVWKLSDGSAAGSARSRWLDLDLEPEDD